MAIGRHLLPSRAQGLWERKPSLLSVFVQPTLSLWVVITQPLPLNQPVLPRARNVLSSLFYLELSRLLAPPPELERPRSFLEENETCHLRWKESCRATGRWQVSTQGGDSTAQQRTARSPTSGYSIQPVYIVHTCGTSKGSAEPKLWLAGCLEIPANEERPMGHSCVFRCVHHLWEGPAAGLAQKLCEIHRVGGGWRPLRDRTLPVVLRDWVSGVSNVTLAFPAVGSSINGPQWDVLASS